MYQVRSCVKLLELLSHALLSQGSHGDKGASRADVILPGATYVEKEGTYVNLEGRPQRAYPASTKIGSSLSS